MKSNKIISNPKYSINKKMIAYVNGKYVRAVDAKIPIYDLGFTNGDMIYDTFRTFNKRPFHLDLHLKRLKKTSEYTGIKITLTKSKIKKIINKILNHNKKFLRKYDDLWCFIRFTRSGSSIIEMNRIKFENYAKYYQYGLRLHTAKIIRTPSRCVDPKGKISANYANLSLAREEVWKYDRHGNALLLDINKNINEGYGFNVFFVKNNTIITPKDKEVLNGVVRDFVEKIAKKKKIKFKKKDIKLKEAYKSEECFITATGWGICPIKSLDKKKFFNKLSDYKVVPFIQNEYSKIVKINFVEQYLKFL